MHLDLLSIPQSGGKNVNGECFISEGLDVKNPARGHKVEKHFFHTANNVPTYINLLTDRRRHYL